MTWVTIEGINGVGKTYMAHATAELLGSKCHLIAELTDLSCDTLPGQVVAALASGGGTFLRGGYPAAETLALLALKTHTYENANRSVRGASVVLEDRGVDTVAMYQAAILTGNSASLTGALAVADQIYATATRWRPPPVRTVLIIDDLLASLSRYEERTGTRLAADDRALLAKVADLYLAQAAREPGRFVVIDRRDRDCAAIIRQICSTCREAAKEVSCPG
jgi:dTMP kinase